MWKVLFSMSQLVHINLLNSWKVETWTSSFAFKLLVTIPFQLVGRRIMNLLAACICSCSCCYQYWLFMIILGAPMVIACTSKFCLLPLRMLFESLAHQKNPWTDIDCNWVCCSPGRPKWFKFSSIQTSPVEFSFGSYLHLSVWQIDNPAYPCSILYMIYWYWYWYDMYNTYTLLLNPWSVLNPHLPSMSQTTLDTDGQILSITWDASPVNDMIADSVGKLITIAAKISTFLCHKFRTCLFIPYMGYVRCLYCMYTVCYILHIVLYMFTNISIIIYIYYIYYFTCSPY